MNRPQHVSVVSLVLCALVLIAAAPARASEFFWSGQGDTDNWYSRHFTGQYDSEHRPIYVNNWGQIGVDPLTPGPGDDATIGGAVTATISYTNNPGISSLFLGAPASLYVANGGSLTVNGPSIVNQGQLHIAYGGMAGGGILQVNGATVSGGGVIVFDDAGTLSGSLTLEAGNLIHGNGGHLTAAMLNRGLVNADVYNSWLRLEGDAKTNAGVFEASNGGRLEVRTAIQQTATGQMIAADNSTVQYYTGSSVIGGTTASSGTGKHLISGGNVTTTLTDVTTTGNWLAENGSFVKLTGSTFTNDGTFEVGGYTGGSGWATLKAEANITLAGTGDLLMNPGIVDSAAGCTLTNSATHTIHGRGYLRAALDNQGQVIADVSGQTLSLESAAKTNAATMKATNGAFLDVKTAITQTPAGQIVAGDGSYVRYYNGSSVAGGTTASSGTGKHLISGGNVTTTLTDVTTTGNWLAENGSFVKLAGSTFTNHGTFEIGGYTGGSGWATLQPADGLTLQGSGTLLLDPGYINNPTPVTVTNASDHTIRAKNGRIYGNVTLNNLGTLEADGGTLTVNTTPLQFSGTTLTGGTWKVSNGTLSIGSSPTVVTNQGRVTLSGSSSVFTPINSLADNQGSFSVLGGRTFHTAGALTNSALLTVGTDSMLAVQGNFTQTAGLTTVDGTLSATGPLAFTGGALAGTGTIHGPVVVGSGFKLSPGHSAGVLTFQQLLLGDGTVFSCEIDGATADRIAITGSDSAFTLASGGTFTIDLSVLNSVGALSEYTLFHWAGADPVFTGTTWVVAAPSGVSADVSFQPDLNSIVLTNVVIPEPASIGLACLAVVSLFARRRR